MTIEKQQTYLKSTSKLGYFGWLNSWFFELRLTWFVTFLLVVTPFIFNGTGLLALLGVIGAALVGIPLGGIFLISGKKHQAKNLKRIVVIILISVSTLFFVFYIDKKIPDRAAKVISAIELFHNNEGHYPKSLNSLLPKYLSAIPEMKPTLVQLEITYQIKDGRPYISIPSARGDQFARYEYDFETKIWKHYQ